MRYSDVISVEEVNDIRMAVGFRRDNLEQLQASLDGSTLIVAVYEDKEAVGFSRLVWDCGGLALIEEVLVIPSYRGKGIEEGMVSRIIDYLRSKLKPGFGIQIDVKSWPYQTNLYSSLGFKESSIEHRGLPMHMCLTEQIEITDKQFAQCGFETGKG